MGISLRDIGHGDGGSISMRGTAAANNLSSEPFTFRELITPQYQSHAEDGRRGWQNWVGDHGDFDGNRVRHTPSTKEELVGAVVSMAEDQGQIRAVGSGHSHSNAPAPDWHYIDLNPGFNTGDMAFNPPDGLNDTLEHNGWLRDDLDGDGDVDEDDREYKSYLKRLESGIVLRRLNRYILHRNGLGLMNMGSFDGQTIAGVVNTSTHGTGIDLASVSDSVKSVEIATVPESEAGDPVVRLYRIEPSEGITDRQKFESDTGDHRMELIQDDDIFHSIVVGYGCMGVVYAYTMEVRDSYWLRERSELMKWSTVRSRLGDTSESVQAFARKDGTRHLQILVNTAEVQSDNKEMPLDEHEVDGDPICLIRRHYEMADRNVPDQPDGWNKEWPPERRVKAFRDVTQTLGNKIHPLKPNEGRAKQMHNNFFHPEAQKKPFQNGRTQSAWFIALRRIRDEGDGGNEYYEPEPPTPTPTTEVAVPLEQLGDAVDAVLQRVQTIRQDRSIPDKGVGEKGRRVAFPIPIGLRFTKESEHFLSPEFERKTAMVELPLPVNEGTTKAALKPNIPSLTQDELREYVVEPALEKVERLLVEDFDGRPHMGKHNTMTASELDRKLRYFDASGATGPDEPAVGWYQVYDHFNAFGTFDGKFTDQLGLDQFSPDRPTPPDPIGLGQYDPTAPSATDPSGATDDSSDTGSDSDSDTSSDSDSDTGSETGTDTDNESGTDTDSQNQTGTGTGTDTRTSTGTTTASDPDGTGGSSDSGGGDESDTTSTLDDDTAEPDIEIELPGFTAATGAAGLGAAAWWLRKRGIVVDDPAAGEEDPEAATESTEAESTEAEEPTED